VTANLGGKRQLGANVSNLNSQCWSGKSASRQAERVFTTLLLDTEDTSVMVPAATARRWARGEGEDVCAIVDLRISHQCLNR
jgi:hypothetical protein